VSIVVGVVAVLLAAYVLVLVRSVWGDGHRPADGAKLAMQVGEAVLMLIVARVTVPWDERTGWLWVLALAVVGAATAATAPVWRILPWVSGASSGRRAVRLVTTAAYLVGLAAVDVWVLAGLA
jgi:hypothetical protein